MTTSSRSAHAAFAAVCCLASLGAGEGGTERAAAIKAQLERLKPTLAQTIDRAKLAEAFKPVIAAKGKSSTGFMMRIMDCEAVAADDFCAPTVTGKEVPPDKDAVKAILAFHTALRGAGIDLIIVPIPNQAMVYAHKLAGAPREALAWPAYTKTMIHLLEQDVEVVDLLADFLAVAESDPPLHQYDHHWSPKGIDIAAKAIAARLQRYGVVRDAAARKAAFTTKDITVKNPTYMFVVNGLARRGAKVPVEPATVTAAQVLRDGKPFKEDTASPVIAIGDSNLNHLFNDSAGLVQHLALETGVVPDRMYQSMAASKVSAEYARLRHGKGPAKKVLVWCIAGTSFEPQYYGGGWPMVTLAGGAPVAAAASGPAVVEASVEAVSKLAKSDYAEALIATRYRVDKVVSGTCGEKQVVVYEWAIKDHKPLPASARRKGEKAKLRLTPWEDAVKRTPSLATMNRMDDLNADDLPDFLGEPQ